MRAIFAEYLGASDPFPERVHINVVAYRLLWDHAQIDAKWAAWALDQVARWPTTRKARSRAELMDVLTDALQDQ
jgi:hypothetical protein